MLDLVLTYRDCVSLVNVTDIVHSTDHFAVEFSLSISYYSCPIPLSEKFIQLQKADFNALYEVLSHVPWDVVNVVYSTQESSVVDHVINNIHAC